MFARWLILLSVLLVHRAVGSDNTTQELFLASTNSLKGGVIFAYPAQGAVNQYFVEKLCVSLNKSGWSVLLLPLSFNSSSPWEDVLAKHLVAIRKKSNSRIILIGYGIPDEPVLQYFRKPQAKQVSGLILLSAVRAKQQSLESTHSRQRLRFPVLDIVGQFDYQPVLEAWYERSQASLNNYTSLKISGGVHTYLHQETVLEEVLNDWMTALKKPPVHRLPGF